MAWYIILTHVVLAVFLFYLINWIGKRSTGMGYMQLSLEIQDDTAPAFNYLFKVLAPVVFIVLAAFVFQKLELHIFCKNIYLIVVYYWVFRLLVVAFLGHLRLQDWTVQIIYWVSSIGISLWAYYSIIDKLETILPSAQSLIEELWLLIILFIYSILNKLKSFRDKTLRRKNNYIDLKYKEFHHRYGDIIDSTFKSDFLRALTFSIMIYENYNRPPGARLIERAIYRRSTKKHTYGIMQVMSNHVLTDKESITLGMEKIQKDCHSSFEGEGERLENVSIGSIIWDVAKSYNKGEDYENEVHHIFNRLNETVYRNIPDQIKESELI